LLIGLGALYNAVDDSFCGISLLKKDPPSSSVDEKDTFETKSSFSVVDSWEKKLGTLDVSAELSASVLSGMVKLEGSAKLLMSWKTNKKEARVTKFCRVLTKHQRLNIMNDELRDCLALDALSERTATHVVVGIQWGGNAVLTVTDANEENEESVHVEGKLKACLERLEKLCISGNAEVGAKFNSDEESSLKSYTFEILGDFAPSPDLKLTSIEDALKIMSQLPHLIGKANDGKGVPLKYELIPLSSEPLRRICQLKYETGDALLKQVSDDVDISMFVNIFDRILECKRQVNERIADLQNVQRNCSCIQRDRIRVMEDIRSEIAGAETRLRNQLKKLLREVRSGQKDVPDLDAFSKEYNRVAPDLCDKCEDIYIACEPLVAFAKLCIETGVRFICRESDVGNELCRHEHVIVLYGSRRSMFDNDKDWNSIKTNFFQMVNKGKQGNKEELNKAVFIYCEFEEKSSNAAVSEGAVVPESKQLRIARYRSGQLVWRQMPNSPTYQRDKFERCIEHLKLLCEDNGFKCELQIRQKRKR